MILGVYTLYSGTWNRREGLLLGCSWDFVPKVITSTALKTCNTSISGY